MTQRAAVQLGTSLLLLPLLLIACGGSGTKPTHLTATQTLAPTATPTPSPIIATTYRLTEGSTISFAPATPNAAGIPPEPLSGTFAVVRDSVMDPNALFAFSITEMDLEAPSGITVSGELRDGYGCAGSVAVGCLKLRTIPIPLRVSMSVSVSINTQSVDLRGSGPFDSGDTPASVHGIEICGAPSAGPTCEDISNGTAGGYTLTIFAVAAK